MMETTTAGLVDDEGNQVALKGVHVEGHLEGLMLVMKLRQQYRNDTERNLETVYTFPLAFGATLLGLNVEIGGRRLHGAVIGAPEARERYEAALEDGDTPVMVEKASEGLFTANLGNLMPGESVVIELEYAQLLRFEQGRIRLTVPTVIAQRYGDPQAKGRLKPHETAAVDPLADYAFSLRLRLLGAIARARVSCPSHRISTALTNDGVDVLLERGGLLDRDFILNLENLWGFSCASRAADGPQTAVLASFCPDLGPQTPQPVALKVLVDCSGSMAGDSIESAKRALHDILQQLSKDDYFAYSRFGSTLVHHHKTLIAGAPANLPGLAQLVARTDANLGGTEMEAAVRGVLNDIKIPAAAARLQPAVLLITDGEIWAVEEMIRLAQHTSQRLFVIGVGAAPGETVLQRLAEHTGGAYEGVSPNEDMAGAIVRMFHRLRGAQAAQVSVDWGATPVWQSPAPRAVYAGETLHLFALFNRPPAVSPRLRWLADGARQECVSSSFSAGAQADALVRLCGARQLALCEDAAAARALALKHQLVSEHTNLFLVYERAAGEKAVSEAKLQQIGQMQAAGQAGMGSLLCASMERPADFDMARMLPDAEVQGMQMGPEPRFMRIVEESRAAPDFSRPPDAYACYSVSEAMPPPAGIRHLFERFNQCAPGARHFADAQRLLSTQPPPDEIAQALHALLAAGFDTVTAWALLLQWLADQYSGSLTLERHARRLLKSALSNVPDARREAAETALSNWF
ncbi:MAG: VIT and VWA domain-containing protein [Gammaproteobacteria bacterium]|nr:VIT and VWA domain-containing protein [Gammaproteobacteria bacterium]